MELAFKASPGRLISLISERFSSGGRATIIENKSGIVECHDVLFIKRLNKDAIDC